MLLSTSSIKNLIEQLEYGEFLLSFLIRQFQMHQLVMSNGLLGVTIGGLNVYYPLFFFVCGYLNFCQKAHPCATFLHAQFNVCKLELVINIAEILLFDVKQQSCKINLPSPLSPIQLCKWWCICLLQILYQCRLIYIGQGPVFVDFQEVSWFRSWRHIYECFSCN